MFNRAGEALAKHGIKFYYHNHGYEFEPHGDGTLFDLLIKETKPEFVSFQMDVMWTVFPGQDPVKLMEKYGNRWALMHVKDLKKGRGHRLALRRDGYEERCGRWARGRWIGRRCCARRRRRA